VTGSDAELLVAALAVYYFLSTGMVRHLGTVWVCLVRGGYKNILFLAYIV